MYWIACFLLSVSLLHAHPPTCEEERDQVSLDWKSTCTDCIGAIEIGCGSNLDVELVFSLDRIFGICAQTGHRWSDSIMRHCHDGNIEAAKFLSNEVENLIGGMDDLAPSVHRILLSASQLAPQAIEDIVRRLNTLTENLSFQAGQWIAKIYLLSRVAERCDELSLDTAFKLNQGIEDTAVGADHLANGLHNLSTQTPQTLAQAIEDIVRRLNMLTENLSSQISERTAQTDFFSTVSERCDELSRATASKLNQGTEDTAVGADHLANGLHNLSTQTPETLAQAIEDMVRRLNTLTENLSFQAGQWIAKIYLLSRVAERCDKLSLDTASKCNQGIEDTAVGADHLANRLHNLSTQTPETLAQAIENMVRRLNTLTENLSSQISERTAQTDLLLRVAERFNEASRTTASKLNQGIEGTAVGADHLANRLHNLSTQTPETLAQAIEDIVRRLNMLTENLSSQISERTAQTDLLLRVAERCDKLSLDTASKFNQGIEGTAMGADHLANRLHNRVSRMAETLGQTFMETIPRKSQKALNRFTVSIVYNAHKGTTGFARGINSIQEVIASEADRLSRSCSKEKRDIRDFWDEWQGRKKGVQRKHEKSPEFLRWCRAVTVYLKTKQKHRSPHRESFPSP